MPFETVCYPVTKTRETQACKNLHNLFTGARYWNTEGSCGKRDLASIDMWEGRWLFRKSLPRLTILFSYLQSGEKELGFQDGETDQGDQVSAEMRESGRTDFKSV